MRAVSTDINDMCAMLTDRLLQHMPVPGHYPTAIPGFVVHRRDVSNTPENCFNRPILAVTVQGAKRTVVGSKEYRYGAGHCLLAGVDMPSMSYLLDARPENPYLVMSLEVDSQVIAQLLPQLEEQNAAQPVVQASVSPSVQASYLGTAVIPTDPEVLSAFFRLLELLDKPEQIPLLAPLLIQEVHVRLLLGPVGPLLKMINTQGTRSNQVLQGINWLREHIASPLNVDALAQRVNMAPATFRKHFKAVTSMSPTQYHKQLRLYESQRLMLENGLDATHACYSVGYESLTQFNREYKRLFGAPPVQNVRQILARAKNVQPFV